MKCWICGREFSSTPILSDLCWCADCVDERFFRFGMIIKDGARLYAPNQAAEHGEFTVWLPSGITFQFRWGRTDCSHARTPRYAIRDLVAEATRLFEKAQRENRVDPAWKAFRVLLDNKTGRVMDVNIAPGWSIAVSSDSDDGERLYYQAWL